MFIARKTHLNLNKVLNEIASDPTALTNFALSRVDEGTTIVMASSADVVNYLMYNYGSFECIHATDKTEFIHIWNAFKSIYSTDFINIHKALTKVYEPLENYDRHEKTEIDNTVTTTNKGSVTNTTENDSQNPWTVTHKSTTEDSSDFYNVSQDETTGKSTSTTEFSNDYENKVTTENDTETRVHGNIGVTTSQQMLESEIKLRMANNFVQLVCDKFADKELL